MIREESGLGASSRCRGEAFRGTAGTGESKRGQLQESAKRF
jgi:hypothetical protein